MHGRKKWTVLKKDPFRPARPLAHLLPKKEFPPPSSSPLRRGRPEICIKTFFGQGDTGRVRVGGCFLLVREKKGWLLLVRRRRRRFGCQLQTKRERERERAIEPTFWPPSDRYANTGRKREQKKGIERTTRNPSIRVHVFENALNF